MHSSQYVFLAEFLCDPPAFKANNGCPCKSHFPTRSGGEGTHAEVAESRAGVRATAFPAAHDVVGFRDQIADAPEIEIGVPSSSTISGFHGFPQNSLNHCVTMFLLSCDIRSSPFACCHFSERSAFRLCL
jgi:hypothetical protein